jgi:dTMP kinase
MATSTQGRLITLEGGEGAGKSTAVATIAGWLSRRGRRFIQTREPGGTPAAERIRGLLLDPETGHLDPLTELLLMFAARAENLRQIIRPALARGDDVICDRFTDASLAYQGYGRGLGPEPVSALRAVVHPDLAPDLTLLLDVPVPLGLSRIGQRDGRPDRFEQADRDFLERVRQGYLAAAAAESDRYCVIDASQEQDAVQRDIIRALEERLR